MAKRQNFVVGSTNPVTITKTQSELNNGWNKYQVLKAGDLDGVFNAVSDYSNDSSNEIANAIQALTGAQPTGGSQNELAGALQQMREDIETSSLTFKGYVATSAPSSSTYGLVEGNIWINANAMPTTFPVAIAGVWNGTSWATTTDTYTVKDFDFFRNINDGEGYYWFGGQWVVMSTDMSTTYFTLNQTSGKWEIKSSVNLPGSPTTTTPAAGDNSTKLATTAWVKSNMPSVSDVVPIGGILPCGGTTAPSGYLICDGSAISRTKYAPLFAVIGTIYGDGDGSTTFNLPDLSDCFVQGGTPGTLHSAGLPNITGSFRGRNAFNDSPELYTGAFGVVNASSVSGASGAGSSPYYFDFDASRSNSIYGNSTTVQPKSVEMLFCIKY